MRLLSNELYADDELEDRYETRLRTMIDAKLAGMPVEAEDAGPPRGNVVDLMEALRRSLAASEPAVETKKPRAPQKKATVHPIEKSPRKRA